MWTTPSSSSSSKPPSTKSPSAPKLDDIISAGMYGVEQGCDVIFLVGSSEDEIWRIPAHKHILQNSTPVFRAMFSEHFCNNHTGDIINVSDVDGRAFDDLMR